MVPRNLIACLVFLAVPAWGLAQSPATVYRCGPDYQPVDLAFGLDGTLYSSDAQFLDFAVPEALDYHPGGLRPEDEAAVRRRALETLHLQSGSVYRHDPEGCTAIAQDWYRPFGLTFDEAGRLCVSHFLLDDPAELSSRHSAISCWDGRQWKVAALGPPSFAYGINGITAAAEGFWAATWFISGSPVILGHATLLSAGGIVREVDLRDAPAHFLLAGPDGSLAITVYRPSFFGSLSGYLARVNAAGKVTTELGEAGLRHPSGLVHLGEDLLIADYALGRLVRVAPDGTATVVREGLEGPMGMRLAPNGKICIAEMRAGRITCLPDEVLIGGSQRAK